MAKKAKKKTVDEISKTVGRIRDELSSRNVGDDLKSLRNEVENLARRVAALELPGRGSSSAAKPRTTASRSTAARKPAASRSTAAKKPAASRSRSTTTRSRSTSTRSRSSGSSS
jgi:hypothetical protein